MNTTPITVSLRPIRFVTRSPEHPVPLIKVNQLGYRPHVVKVGKISAPNLRLADHRFRIVDLKTGRTVFQGQLRRVTDHDPFSSLHRCGIALAPQYAGPLAHKACHLGDRQALTRDGKEQRDVSGGRHDLALLLIRKDALANLRCVEVYDVKDTTKVRVVSDDCPHGISEVFPKPVV